MGATLLRHCMSASLISASDQVAVSELDWLEGSATTRVSADDKTLHDFSQVIVLGDHEGMISASKKTKPQNASSETTLEQVGFSSIWECHPLKGAFWHCRVNRLLPVRTADVLCHRLS